MPAGARRRAPFRSGADREKAVIPSDAGWSRCQTWRARYWWTERTALDPSPTAAATRFIEPSRDVANGEHAGKGRLEREGVPAGERVAVDIVVGQGAVGQHEPVAVERDAVAQPGGGRDRPR